VVVEPEDPAAVERLIRYVMRPPVALERVQYDEAAGVMEIRSRPGSNHEPGHEARERVDADELVARVIAQVPGSEAAPDPRVRVVRQRRARETEAGRDPAFGAGRGAASRLGVVRRGDYLLEREGAGGASRTGAPRWRSSASMPELDIDALKDLASKKLSAERGRRGAD